jgi:hypothetical protein
MTDLSALTRDELNAHAESVGIADPAGFPNKGELVAAIEAAETPAEAPTTLDDAALPDPVRRDIERHLADPQATPLPAGVVINFGDPEPIRYGGGQR